MTKTGSSCLAAANDPAAVWLSCHPGEVCIKTPSGEDLRLSPSQACALGLSLLDAAAQAMGLVSGFPGPIEAGLVIPLMQNEID